MADRRPFKEVKLQWLQLLSCDPKLTDTARSVALYIVTTHINGHTEKAWPSYQTIANAMGKSVKTIQRAIHDLELGGWFDVVRGNGVGRSTRYAPTEASIIKASEAREKTDKIVHLKTNKGGQNCPERRSNLSGEGRQNCPPNLENLKNKKLNARGKASPPEDGRRAIPALFVAEHETVKLDRWQEWFGNMGLNAMNEIAPRERRRGRNGFLLPSYYPPSPDEAEKNREWFEYFQRRQSTRDGGHGNGLKLAC